jgi:uroporphyrinogen-III synthase
MTTATVPLVVTRPEPEASAWVAQLNAWGVPALSLPLLVTRSASAHAQAAWQAALRSLADLAPSEQPQAWMAVSAPAVRFAHAAAGALWQPDAWSASGIAAWATGPGTRAAWCSVGWPASHVYAPAADAPQFDSEALWDVVQAHVRQQSRRRPVWLLRGADGTGQPQGRDWLQQQLHGLGVAVVNWPLYERMGCDWTVEADKCVEQALAAQAVWCISSSQALEHLLLHLPPDGAARTRLRLLVTHPRMAERAAQLGLAPQAVRMCQPQLASVRRAWAQGWA